MPTKSAFIQQRKKLNDNAFPHVLYSLNSIFPFKKKFHSLHLLACDGSDVNIPPKPGDTETYVASNTAGVGYHQMHLNAKSSFLKRFPLPSSGEFDQRVSFEVTRKQSKLYKNHPDRFYVLLKDRPFDLIPADDRTVPVDLSPVDFQLPEKQFYPSL